MGMRFGVVIGSLGTLAVIVAIWLVSGSGTAQAPAAAPPRTDWGDPDLQGIWTSGTSTPNTLLRRGLTRDSLLPGTEIVVDGYQSKDGSLRANGRDLTFLNGETVFLGGSSIGAPEREDDAGE